MEHTKKQIIKEYDSVLKSQNVTALDCRKEDVIKHYLEKKSEKTIDKVTTSLLDVALRMCDIEINKAILDRLIDVVEIITEKGGDVSLKDVSHLKDEWIRHSK
jgi:hypothetical protein